MHIFCRRAGLDRPGPPYVLVHGFRGSHADFSELESLLAARRQTLAVDLRLHGLSTQRPSPVSADLCVADIEQVLERHGLQRVTLVGHSFGSSLCVLLAAARPELVDAVVLMGASAYHPPHERVSPEDDDTAFTEQIVQFFERVGPLFFHDDHPHVRQRVLAEWLAAPLSSQRLLVGLEEPDLRDTVAGVNAPTLVVVGEESRASTLEEGRWLVEHLPRAELSVIPRTGHFMLMEDAPEVAARILAFEAG